jgi:hypothetical protein
MERASAAQASGRILRTAFVKRRVRAAQFSALPKQGTH